MTDSLSAWALPPPRRLVMLRCCTREAGRDQSVEPLRVGLLRAGLMGSAKRRVGICSGYLPGKVAGCPTPTRFEVLVRVVGLVTALLGAAATVPEGAWRLQEKTTARIEAVKARL
jgi:hypothetical protein